MTSDPKKFTFYSTFRSNFFTKKEYEPPFNKYSQKNNEMSFELEKNRETIMQLKQKIIKQENEIKLLKVKNIKNDDYMLKTIKIIEEVLSQSDISTQYAVNIIEDYYNKNPNKKQKKQNEKENETEFKNDVKNENKENNEKIIFENENFSEDENNNNDENNNENNENKEEQKVNEDGKPNVKKMIHLNKKQKKILREICENVQLKKQIKIKDKKISNQNLKLEKLNEDKQIIKIKTLQNNYMKMKTLILKMIIYQKKMKILKKIIKF